MTNISSDKGEKKQVKKRKENMESKKRVSGGVALRCAAVESGFDCINNAGSLARHKIHLHPDWWKCCFTIPLRKTNIKYDRRHEHIFLSFCQALILTTESPYTAGNTEGVSHTAITTSFMTSFVSHDTPVLPRYPFS